MNYFKTYFLTALASLILLCCSSSAGDDDAVFKDDEEEVIVEENNIPTIPHEGIPSPFNLFTVIDSDVERKEFNKIAKWYEESPNKQVFKLFTGDEFNGDRTHARTEAGQGLKWKEGQVWHYFEATMQPSGTLNKTYTIAQLFAGCCGPQLRIAVKPSGRVDVESRDNDNIILTPETDYVNGINSFKIKIRSNGKLMEVYYNDELKFSALSDESRKGNKNALYHFRWGVYSNEKMIKNLSNVVTNITRK